MKGCFLIVLLVVFGCSGTKQNGMFENPIIPGFNPDPSICRVGEDYYLVANSSEYYPGIPVYHSRDLVNWKIIGHALHRTSQLDLDSVDSSRGIFAPTIRYHNGTFYVLSTLTGAMPGKPSGNFIVTAQNPAGPWSEIFWLKDAQGIDPSLFFDDDGKVYYHGNYSPAEKAWPNHRNIWIQELDLSLMEFTGERYDIIDGSDYYRKGTIDGGIETGVDFFEAPHIYKKDGFYYLVTGHGGTFQNHAVSIWKAENIYGPYESNPGNPILTHRDLPATNYITSVGHADLVETQNGEWWMVYLGRRPYGGEYHILGREIFLSPMDWSSTWPVVNPSGETGRGERFHHRPDLPVHKQVSAGRDNFDSCKPDLRWYFLRTPRSDWWSLTEREGFLRMYLRPENISEPVNPSFIGRRQEHINCSVEIRMEFDPVNDGEEAGLVVERDRNNYFIFSFGQHAGRKVVRLTKRSSDKAEDEIVASEAIETSNLHLRITAEGILYTFSYAGEGEKWKTLVEKEDARFLGMAGAGRFTGTLTGMYASSNGIECNNHADFDWFEYQKLTE
jgi:xylan 1,4-beta-xylosidase